MKYKVGDKVRVRRDIKPGWGKTHRINEEMAKMKGNILTVRRERESVGYMVCENIWSWSDDMLEPLTEGTFPSFAEIVESAGIQEGDRILINGHELTYTGKIFVDKSGKRTDTKILGIDFKILPKPKTGAEILAQLKEIRGEWEPDWENWGEGKYSMAYDYMSKAWTDYEWYASENSGALLLSKEATKSAEEYLNTLTEEESMNLLKEMRI